MRKTTESLCQLADEIKIISFCFFFSLVPSPVIDTHDKEFTPTKECFVSIKIYFV